MTHAQMIEVIQAHRNGRLVEMRRTSSADAEWTKMLPSYTEFDFSYYEYRIALEPRVRPWQSLDEIPVGSVVVSKGGYVKSMILRADKKENIGTREIDFSILVGDKRRSTREMLANYVMLDGSPCGVLDDAQKD